MNPARRQFLSALGVLTGTIQKALSETKATRLLLIHGRGQQGQNASALQSEWLKVLLRGASAAGLSLPTDLKTDFPFYGDALDRFTREATVPLTSEVTNRGEQSDDFTAFQAEFVEAIRLRAGVTDDQVDSEYGSNVRPRGPLNWEWVQAMLRAVDKYGGGMGGKTLEIFTRDVFLYCTRAGVRDEIDRIVASALTAEPTVVVAHSLGTVVAYSVLRRDTRRLQIPAFITVGSPLGLRSVRDQFRPLRFPPVERWYNAFDPRDVVALYPLDGENFPVSPPIVNNGMVTNRTDNRHGISGYLDDLNVARQILASLE